MYIFIYINIGLTRAQIFSSTRSTPLFNANTPSVPQLSLLFHFRAWPPCRGNRPNTLPYYKNPG